MEYEIIDCLGIDGNRHRCYPDAKECLCSMRINSKDNYTTRTKFKYDCYKCSSMVEQMERDNEEKIF